MRSRTSMCTAVSLGIALAVSTSCSRVGVTRLKHATAKPETCNIDVYTSESEIEREFEAVCYLDSRTGSTLGHDRSVSGAIQQAKPEACKCGGDAIIIADSSVKGMGAASWGEGTAMLRVVRYVEATPNPSAVAAETEIEAETTNDAVAAKPKKSRSARSTSKKSRRPKR